MKPKFQTHIHLENLTFHTVNASWLTPFEPFLLYIDINSEDPLNMIRSPPCSHSTSCTETWLQQHPPIMISQMHNHNCHRFPEKTSEGKLHSRKVLFLFFRTKDD